MSRLPSSITRRDLLKAALPAAALAAGLPRRAWAAGEEKLPPVRAITQGPKFHWFGYYDKLQFDPGSRYVLGMEVDFEHRSPEPGDVVKLGMIDLADGDRWIDLAESRAWCWQQGCMLQWRPGSKTEVVFNDRDDDRFVSRILDVKSGQMRTLPGPIYAISPDGTWAVAPDFRRLHDTRPGYGYAGIPDPSADEPAPKTSGIWRVDLNTGEHKLLFSVADVLDVPHKTGDFAGAKHWFNHLLVNTDGSRFEFLHRWARPGQKGFDTHMLTAKPDGSDIRIIDPSGKTSHFIWRDPAHILAWSWHESHGNGFYLFEDRAPGAIEIVGLGIMKQNGHCSYLPGNRWILNDTYPDKQRNQNPYLFEVATGKVYPLGHFASPKEYGGEWRCDLHPRFSPHGSLVTVDSPHAGQGRQIYLIDIAAIVGTARQHGGQ